MLCPGCNQSMGILLAPVINCPKCGNKCLPPLQKGDLQFEVQVPAEAGAGSSSPFGLPLSNICGPNDPRAVLIVPPVELPSGTVLTVAVGSHPGENVNFGEHFDFEGVIVKIDLPVAGVSSAPESQNAVKSSGGFLKVLAASAVSSVSSVMPSQMATAAARPKTIILRSNLHYFGPLALAQPIIGLEAGVATALGSAFPCGACNRLVKCNDKCVVFRCGGCGVLSTFPVMDKEQVMQVQISRGKPAKMVVVPERGRKVLVSWPVSNTTDTVVTIAVPPKGMDFGKLVFEALFAVVVTVGFIMDPLGAAAEGAANVAIDKAIGQDVDNALAEVDAQARVLASQ